MATRSKRLRVNAQRLLRSYDEELSVPETIFEALSRVQDRIAEETHCVERVVELDVDEEVIRLPDDFISIQKVISTSTDQTSEIVGIDFTQVDRLKRGVLSRSGEVPAQLLMYYYLWGQEDNREIRFLLSDGSAPSSTITVNLYYWALPEDMTEDIEPEVPRRWETTLLYGAVSDLTQEPKFLSLYDNYFLSALRKEVSARSVASQVPYNDSYD